MPDYSPWYIGADESLVDYYKRLAGQREGGILGTSGLMDKPVKKDKETTKEVDPTKGADLGVVKVSDSGDGEPYKDPYEGSDAQAQGFTKEEFDREAMLKRLTGRQYAGQGLMYGIPNLLSNWSDREALRSDLLRQGWTEEQIERALANPEYLMATNSLERLGGLPTEEYRREEAGTQDSLFKAAGSVVGSIFGLNDSGPKQSPYSPMVSPAYPSFNQGMMAQVQAAQNAQMFDPYGNIIPKGGMFSQDYWVNASAERVEAERIAAEQEAARQAEASRQAEMQAALEQANSGGGSSWGDSGYYTDSSGNSYTGGSDYGGWTGVTADGSGNDWDSFGGDLARDA